MFLYLTYIYYVDRRIVQLELQPIVLAAAYMTYLFEMSPGLVILLPVD